MTYFSLNLMAYDQYQRAQRESIQRRLMIRLQMLGAIGSRSTKCPAAESSTSSVRGSKSGLTDRLAPAIDGRRAWQ